MKGPYGARPGAGSRNRPRWRPAAISRLVSKDGLMAVGARPDLWFIAVSVAMRSVPSRWWHRWPPLPLPTAEYVDMRLEAMFGHGSARNLEPDELLRYLEWCRRMKRLAR